MIVLMSNLASEQFNYSVISWDCASIYWLFGWRSVHPSLSSVPERTSV